MHVYTLRDNSPQLGRLQVPALRLNPSRLGWLQVPALLGNPRPRPYLGHLRPMPVQSWPVTRAEAAFRQLKDVDHLTVRPQYHWTDQKVRVHTFICLLAYLLCRLIERECRTIGYQGSLSHLLELLGSIRLALLVQPSGARGGHPRCTWVLEESEPEATRLFHHLVPQQPPFVYTSTLRVTS